MRPPSLLYGFAWRQRIGQAARILALEEPTEPQLQLVLSIGRWWEPLRAIHAAHHQASRERNTWNFILTCKYPPRAMVNRFEKRISLIWQQPKRISLFPLGDLQTFSRRLD